MKYITKQPNQFEQCFFQTLRCVTYRHIHIEGEKTHCWLYAGHHAIDSNKKEEAAA